jgi:hypothetical protein
MNFELADLPSRGILVDSEKYSKLTIGRIGIRELSLFSQSVQNKNPDNFVEAVKNVINIPLHFLTLGDFYFIVTHLRCDAFKNSPLSLTWRCDGFWYTSKDSDELITSTGARSILESEDNIRLFPHSCGEHNHKEYTFADIGVVYLSDTVDIDTEIYSIPGAGLYAEYVRLSKEPTLVHLLPAIQWIKEGKTLKQKLEWLKTQQPNEMDIFDQASRHQEKYSHGVRNTLFGKCKKCDTLVHQKFELTPESFFRET